MWSSGTVQDSLKEGCEFEPLYSQCVLVVGNVIVKVHIHVGLSFAPVNWPLTANSLGKSCAYSVNPSALSTCRGECHS